jgi:hypothetical protein
VSDKGHQLSAISRQLSAVSQVLAPLELLLTDYGIDIREAES